MAISLADIGLNSIGKIIDALHSGRSKSLIDYTKPTRVEPLVVIDAACMTQEVLGDVMQSLQAMFSAYYLQAISISNVVGNIEIVRQLDKLSPKRDPVNSAIGTGVWLMSQESYKNGLPMLRNRPTQEAFGDSSEDGDTGAVVVSPNYRNTQLGELQELANLSVGRLLNVEICNNDQKAIIPISIRLIANSLPSKSIVHILSQEGKETTISERWHGWRSGKLAFLRDIILCRDLIDAHRRKLLNDGSGTLASVINRRNGNKLSGLLSLNPSVATISNMVVLDQLTAEEIERQNDGRFKDYKFRQRIFDETSVMMCVIIEKDLERVRIYHHGIPDATELTYREIKAVNSKGNDVAEILKAFTLGQAPRF